MKVFAIGVAFAALLVASAAIGGAIVMLLAGAVFAEFGWLRPIGFWPSTGIYIGLSFLSAFLRASKGSN